MNSVVAFVFFELLVIATVNISFYSERTYAGCVETEKDDPMGTQLCSQLGSRTPCVINLELKQTFYCHPEGYEIDKPFLDDIKNVLNPRCPRE